MVKLMEYRIHYLSSLYPHSPGGNLGGTTAATTTTARGECYDDKVWYNYLYIAELNKSFYLY